MLYENKTQLLDEINKTATLFIDEFTGIANEQKDTLFCGVDRTPAQMLAYQLGWLKLVKSWDDTEVAGGIPELPASGYKWNKLGELYQQFYAEHQSLTLTELISQFKEQVALWHDWISSLSDEVLFIKDHRHWTTPFPANWTVARFIHINSVAPFKTFRTKIRKWKKLSAINLR